MNKDEINAFKPEELAKICTYYEPPQASGEIPR